MAAPESVQARRAALLLHGLPAHARRQVIARLDLAERARLTPLLAELSELGLSQSLGRHLQQALPEAPQETARAPTVREQVARLAAEDVLRCLQLCSPATAACLVRAGDWPWKAELLARLPQPQRGELIERLRGECAALAPAVFLSLCRRLCEQAALLQVEPGEPVPANASNTPWPPRRGIRKRLERLAAWMR